MTDSLASGAEINEPLAASADAANPPAAADTVDAGKPAPAANGEAGADAAGKWPENWRQLMAGEDKKTLDRLGRFATPADIWKAQENAEKKISEGVKPLQRPGAKATDAEWQEYRKAAGIPDGVDDYVKSIALPDNRQIGEEDLPVVKAFAERAIKNGTAPADMAAMVDEYYALQEDQANQLAERDATFRKQSEQALKEEYGGDFKANLAAMRPYFDSFDGELFDSLMGGRLADGSKIGDNPNLIRFFVAKAIDENPAATIVPGGNTNMEAIDTEIAALEKRMGEDRTAWFKDAAAQKRYQQLLTARDKLAK